MKRNLEWKVGIFVAISLAFAAILVMKFSKGAGLLTRTYTLHLKARNVGGIIPGSSVLMAGVPIGGVKEIDLARDGSSVMIHAEILDKYKIAVNAIFSIRQAGFLGDRFIAVSPGPPLQPGDSVRVLKDDDVVQCQEAFDIAQVAESASGLMDRLNKTFEQLNTAVLRLDMTLLADESLSNLTLSVANFRNLSERALVAVGSIDSFVTTNVPSLNTSVSNFALFTENLNRATVELRETVATNRVGIAEVVRNLDRASHQVNAILADVEQGKGLAGNLLSNPELASHTSLMISNFMVFSSNINTKGLWGVIRKPKIPKAD